MELYFFLFFQFDYTFQKDEVKYLAPFAYWRLEKTLKQGAESTPYTLEVINSFLVLLYD